LALLPLRRLLLRAGHLLLGAMAGMFLLLSGGVDVHLPRRRLLRRIGAMVTGVLGVGLSLSG